MFSEKKQKAGIRIRTVFIAVMCCLFIAVTPVKVLAAPAEGATVQYSGTRGTVRWEIYTDGTLVIRPTRGNEGTMTSLNGNTNGSPWYSRRTSIKRVETQGTIRLGANAGFLFGYLANCTEIDLSGLDTSNVTNMSGMFYNCSGLTSIDVSRFDTENATNMSYMFGNCSSLTSLDVSGFDTGSVTTMESMFSGCSGLTSLDVSGLETEKVTNMYCMFRGCAGLASLDISEWDTSKVTDVCGMFDACSGLTSINVSGIDTSSVKYMDHMFSNCSGLTSLNVNSFDTSKVLLTEGMFSGCSGLKNLDISNFNTSKVDGMSGMFNGCSSLTSLDISGLDTRRADYMDNMFLDCSNLSEIVLGDSFRFKGRNITYTSYQALLPTPPSATTTGKWVREDGTVEAKTPAELRAQYDANAAAWAGKWVWEEKLVNYTVGFTAENATGSMPDQKINAEEDGTLNPCAFRIFDHTFDHWEGSDGRTYTDGQVIPAGTFNVGDTLTLTAVFTKDQHALNFTDGEAEFTLKAGEKAVFPGIPGGASYQVWEETPSGWQLVRQSDPSGTIPANGTAEAKFWNEYVPGTATVALMAQKTIDGRTPEEGAFEFELLDSTGAVIETASNNAAGLVEFRTIVFEQPGTFVYSIREKRGDDDAVNYDAHTEVVTVTVEDDGNGNLTAVSSSAAAMPSFSNETRPGMLQVTKRAQGGSGDEVFTFEIELTNEAGMPLDSVNIVGGQ